MQARSMIAEPCVVVAMSGGVDSSLTAALLLRQGYKVIGATMRLWEEDMPEDGSQAAIADAKRVAEHLGIVHHVFDLREEFRKWVIDYFIAEYAAGRTPNPCVACNRYIKFDRFWQLALSLGATRAATGHYARVAFCPEQNRYSLYKAVDARKDQSYALYYVRQSVLKNFLLPLGEYGKDETRLMAREYSLPVADKPDSQEICFIPDDDYKGFLNRHIPDALRAGNIVDTSGKLLGRHGGLPFYTIGQRKGLGIAAAHPLYVVRLDTERNEVVVGGNEDVFASALIADDMNYLAVDELTAPIRLAAKIRYNAPPAPATVSPHSDGQVKVEFDTPQRAVTPGQSVVFYDGDMVFGGGVIAEKSK